VKSCSELNRRFGIEGVAAVVEGNGGLPKVRVVGSGAIGEMYLHGAQVMSWRPQSAQEVFYVSQRARWEDGRAIRGGVPICFPWFGGRAGDPDAPAHGFARASAWELESIERDKSVVTVTMTMNSDSRTKRWWPADFRLAHRATFGPELTLELIVTNSGTTSLRFEEAFHAYYRIGRIERVRVGGLDRMSYLDKTDGDREKVQNGDIVIGAETDRVFLNTIDTVDISDAVLGRRISISKEGSRTTVVWNPWIEKAQTLADVDEDWMRFVCIEPSNVSAFGIDLGPGQLHKMRMRVRVDVP
jgi:glucose-6-phosphate 1-epimerase